jgi:hypothetical protein
MNGSQRMNAYVIGRNTEEFIFDAPGVAVQRRRKVRKTGHPHVGGTGEEGSAESSLPLR